MVEAAVSALIGARRGQEPEHLIFPAKLRVRRSCGCQENLTAPETVDAAEGSLGG